MTVDIDTPVDAIEGIGSASAVKLAESGVHTVFDLLRAPPSATHHVVKSLASLQQVQTWSAMASLLLVKGMTAQWAEALAEGGIGSLSELSVQELRGLAGIFTAAMNAGLIPAVPDEAALWEFMRDATVLSYTGILPGTVNDSDGNAVVGATAKLGAIEGTTNPQGRFLLARVRLGIRQPLIITHPDHRTLVVNDPPVAARQGVTTGRVFTVRRKSAVAPTAERVLSELHGDAVPVPNGLPMRESTHGHSELEEGDVLMVHLFYERSPEAKLVSRFKRYVDGEFLVKSFRVPLARLPNGVQLRQNFHFESGTFKAFPSSAEALRREIAKRAVRKQFSAAPLGLDEDERNASIPERMRALGEAGLFRGRF